MQRQPRQLSADQTRYAAELSRAAGLPPVVAEAWVASVAGWGVFRGDHAYLAGPSRASPIAYQTPEQAARAVAPQARALVRAAVPAGPVATLAEIGAQAGLPGETGRLVAALGERARARTAPRTTTLAAAATGLSRALSRRFRRAPALQELSEIS